MLRNSIVLMLLATATAVPAMADVLVLKDGRRLTGTVEEGDGVYVVQHDGKKVTVPDTQVAEWIAGQTDGPNAGAGAAVPLDEVKFDPAPAASTDSSTEPTTTGVSASLENGNQMAQVDRSIAPRVERAVAFAVSRDLLVTSARVAVGGGNPQLVDALGDGVTYEVVRADEKLGLALLRVSGATPLSPLMLADSFDAARVNGGGAMRIAGYIGPDMFQPALEYADCAAEKPSAAKPWTVKASRHPVTPGGPVLIGNLVVGVQLADERAQPEQVPAVTLEQLRKFLGKDYTKPKSETDPAAGVMQFSAEHIRSPQ
jgi:hypothetical protein